MGRNIRYILVALTLFTLTVFLLPVSSAQLKGATITTSGQSANYFNLGRRFMLANFAFVDEGFTDLGVTKSADQDTVAAGSNLTYTIQVANFGPDNAPNATLNDVLPMGTTFVSVSAPAGWSCSDPGVGNNGTVTCTNASLPLTSGDTITLVVNVDSGTPANTFITNTATVSTDTFDINDENNSSSASSTVAGAGTVDVGVSKVTDNGQALAGSNVTYTIQVTKPGSTAAADVVLHDTLPGDMTFVSLMAPPGWSCMTPSVGAGGTIECSNPSLGVTGGETFTLVGNIPGSASDGTEYANTATVSTSTPDTNPENDSSTATTTVVTCFGNQTVTTNADSGPGSLRQAILDACPGNTINFAPGLVGPITLTSGELVIEQNLTIVGLGANRLTVRRDPSASDFRIFNIQSGSTVSISGLTISNGHFGGSSSGGGIFNSGNLTLTDSVVSNNSADSGAGIYGNGGTLTVIGSTISGNTVGGGIYIGAGTASIINSTISGNTSQTGGGGITHASGGSLKITNSTITANRAIGGSGGGIQVASGTVVLNNTIVAGNFSGASPSTTADDISGTVDPTSSFNLIGTGGSGGLTNGTNGNQVGVADPMLGPLANNGGRTPTHLLLPGSPAINAGSNALAVDQSSNPLTTDQRGTGFPRIVNTTVDIGAVEVNYAIAATAGTPQSAPINTAFATQLQATVGESGRRVSGIPVTFTAPATGPSGTFAGNTTTVTITTDANGEANAPVFTANGTVGGPYNVTASLRGGTPIANFSLTNLKGQAQVTLSNLTQTYDGTPKSVTVTTNPPGLNVDVTYNGSTTPPTNAGSYAVVATVNDPNYQGQATGTLVINKADQTITFGPLSDKTFGDPDFTVSATATSGLTVSFAASGQCTVSGNTVHITGPGSCTITASQAGDSNYNASTPVSRSFNIVKAATTTTVSSSVNPSDVGQTVTFTATVTSAAGTPTGTVQFQFDNVNVGPPMTLVNGAATISTTGLSAGTHTISAAYSGDGNFNSSTGALQGGQVVRDVPTLSISDASVTEGNSGTTTATFTVTLSATSNLPVTVNYATADGTATLANNDYQAASGSLTFNSEQPTTQTISVTVNGDTVGENNETFFVNLSNASNAAISRAQGVGTILNDDPPVIQLSASSYDVAESGGRAVITVNRLGDLSSPANVDYATSDSSGLNNCSQVTGQASQRCDYTTVVGTLRFAAGESSKTISVPLINDVFVEGPESFTITLNNATGEGLGSPTTATVNIADDDFEGTPNPLLDDAFFVRQLYIDFLGREPDPAGLQGWLNVLHSGCNPSTNCDRIAVALGFVRSPEFLDRGYFAFRFYTAALGRNPRYSEFIPDMASLSGFLNGSDLEANKNDFVAEFTSRQEFKNLYDPTIGDPTSYVDKLLQTAGLPNHPARNAWIAQLTNNQLTREQVLRQLVESQEVASKFFNQAFIVMNYFGFLRRDPDAAYQGWVNLFNQTGDYRAIVNGFLNSTEYPLRFGH